MIPSSLINMNGDLLCAVDTETTGLIPGYHEVIQVAVVPLNSEMEQHPDIKPFYMNIAPDHPERESGAGAVHGISMEELMACPSQMESADMFDEWFTGLDLPLGRRIIPLAHNWAFERTYLLHWLGLETFTDIWSGHPRDTLIFGAMLNDLADWQGRPVPFNRLKLSCMCEVFGIRLLNAHDALADCLATARLYREMLRCCG
jgi:DNA polymerase III epsilon subunit-like protein